MNWRISQADSRRHYLEKFDSAEADAYDTSVGALSDDDEAAYRSDLAQVCRFGPGQRVLDAGAGGGALCKVLCGFEDLAIAALEPAPAMLAKLRGKPALRGIETVQGFCDHADDRCHFPAGAFDIIVSRQLANGLYDPLTAFRNWHHWLKPGGTLAVIEGLYGRTSWTGRWEEEVDTLPLSACQTTATVPYLLEEAGFRVEAVEWMQAVNARPTTRTTRYVVRAARTD